MSDIEIVDDWEMEGEANENCDLESDLKRVEKELKDVTKQIKVLEAKKRYLERQRNEISEKLQDQETWKIKQQNWDRKSFEWSDRLDAALVGVFGLKEYRNDQLAVINASLSGHDVILIMPTGGGKSLTYQLPAVISPGMTLVVTPLISLMEDQIFALQKLDVNCGMLNSSTEKEEKSRIFQEMSQREMNLKLLYVTPEKCSKSKQFMTKLQKLYQAGKLARIAIDEVHCCSQWGHDFRPDYKFLGAMKGMFPEVPILGLTATSTAEVTKDVKSILRIPSGLVFLSGFNRPNLHYSVRLKPEDSKDNYDNLAQLVGVQFRGQSGIIYTTTIKEVETVTDELRKRDIAAGFYHAQMDPKHRRRVHQSWLAGKVQVVVATLAFGMGIDKQDVRFVIHNAVPKSMENFYQESGRAGRDGKNAQCILFFRLGDLFKQSTMVFTEQTGLQKLYSMIGYCLNGGTCRRNLIAEHFLETWESIPCDGMCDICDTSTSSCPKDIADYQGAAVRILQSAANKELRVTGLKLVDALLGRGAANLKLADWKAKDSKDIVEAIVAFLIVEGYIKEDFHFTPYSTISYLVPGGRRPPADKTIRINIPKFRTKSKPAASPQVAKAAKPKAATSPPKVPLKPAANSPAASKPAKNSPVAKMAKSNSAVVNKKRKTETNGDGKSATRVPNLPKAANSVVASNFDLDDQFSDDDDFVAGGSASNKNKKLKSIILDSDSD